MNRFIAIIWNERLDKGQADARKLMCGIDERWRRSWEKPGLVVFEAAPQGPADMRSEADDLFIVGAAFNRAGAIVDASSFDAAAARKSHGAALVSQVWGRYVAFIRDESEACLFVLRDPSGALPCFFGKRGQAYAFFSNPDDVALFAFDRHYVDWAYVAERLANNRVVTQRTGLVGVGALPPGCVARFGQGRLDFETPWRAESVAAATEDMPEDEAAHRVRAAIDLSCGALGSLFSKAGLRLSGGLDSSIVMAALGPRLQIEALNFATINAEGDERAFARAAAAFAGASLSERIRNAESVDLLSAVEHAPTLNPHLWLADGETDAIEGAFAAEKGIDAFFSGRGGDNVFFRSEQPHVLADWLNDQGFGPAFLKRAWRYSALSGMRFSTAISGAFAMHRGRTSRSTPLTHRFLTPKAVALLGDCALDEPMEWLPPGKRLHVRSLNDRLNYFDYRAHADYIYPLIMQPVLEACLSLPTYTLSPAGNDRALARRAYSDRVAPEILARQSKGRTNGYLARILLRHVVFLRSFLLEGALAGEGLVLRDELDNALTERALMRSMEDMARIVGMLGVEAWLRRWPAPRAAETAPTISA